MSTLFDSVLEMLIFGFLADIYGRRKLYGLELIVVIFRTKIDLVSNLISDVMSSLKDIIGVDVEPPES